MKQKIIQFINSVEEKYIFPIGRRTWQVLSFLGLLGLILGIVWLVLNMLPTPRESVRISKEEVKNNAVDTTAKAEVVATCTEKEVADYFDSIRRMTKSMEWENLGLMEDEEYYLVDEYGNYIYNEYTYGYQTGTRKVFRPNPNAIPNIFQSAFNESAIDSSDFCSKKNLLVISFTLLKQFDNKFLADAGPSFVEVIARWSQSLNLDQLNHGIAIYSITNSKVKPIANQTESRHLANCIELAKNDFTESELTECRNLISKHQSLKKVKQKLEPSDYLEIIEITGESDVDVDNELENAVRGFSEDIEYYDNNGLIRSYKKYLSLYSEKLNNAMMKQSLEKAEKSKNRLTSLMLMGAGFFTVVTIAIILLLFSIQSILKKRN